MSILAQRLKYLITWTGVKKQGLWAYGDMPKKNTTARSAPLVAHQCTPQGNLHPPVRWALIRPWIIRSVEGGSFEVVLQMSCLAYECKWSMVVFSFSTFGIKCIIPYIPNVNFLILTDCHKEKLEFQKNMESSEELTGNGQYTWGGIYCCI